MDNEIDILEAGLESKIVDSRGRVWRTHKDVIEKLADLMNEQSIHPLQTSDELFHIFDAVLTTEEINFMLIMGGKNHTLETLIEATELPKITVERITNSLVQKGPIAIIKDEVGKDVYHVMTIFPGWFELYLMRGVDDEEHRLFAERVEELFVAAKRFGNEEVINELMRDVGPHIKIIAADKPKIMKIDMKNEIPINDNKIFATTSITNFFEQLDEDEIITIGHCFCRFEKELIGDPCRAGLPLETCISIGPAAEHLMKQGIAKRITKADAIARIKDFQDKGCIHQSTRTIPIKDFKTKYPADIFCNCCWDCCGIIGNYNRGNLPYILKTYHRASIANEENCTGCGSCIEFCPIGAMTLSSSNIAKVDDETCIGCGQCYHHCKENVIELIEDEREIFLPILDKDKVRVSSKPLEEDIDDGKDLESLESSREEVLSVLESTRMKFADPELSNVFKKWNKTVLYHFTDMDEYWNFVIENGQPGPLQEGKIENPSIFYCMAGSIFVGMMRKEIDAFTAFRKKLVKVKAPVKDLIKLQKLID